MFRSGADERNRSGASASRDCSVIFFILPMCEAAGSMWMDRVLRVVISQFFLGPHLKA